MKYLLFAIILFAFLSVFISAYPQTVTFKPPTRNSNQIIRNGPRVNAGIKGRSGYGLKFNSVFGRVNINVTILILVGIVINILVDQQDVGHVT